MKNIFAALLLITLTLPAYPYYCQLQSPDGNITVRFLDGENGRLSMFVGRGREYILGISGLSLTIDGIDYCDSFTFGQMDNKMPGETKYTWRGVHSQATNHYNQAYMPIKHKKTQKVIIVEARAFNDGFAYRFMLPGKEVRNINSELSKWTFPEGISVWYQTNTNNYEGIYEKKKPADIEKSTKIGFPVTIEYPDGTYGAITEAGLFAHSGLIVTANGTNSLVSRYEDDPDGWKQMGPIITPWRVMMTGPTLNDLVNSDIIHNLCPEPIEQLFPEGMNTEWIKPGRSLWNWWSDSSVDFKDQKKWIDKTAEMGFEYYLVDAGWEKHWTLPDKDKWACLKELCDYAKPRNVRINVWKHWNQIEKEDARKDFMSKCASAGAAGLKIDFMDSESRERIRFYTSTLRQAAELKLMVNFHGANKPTGEPRTFPNEMTREGIRGLEYNKWSALPKEHYATLPFTRLLAGHGDFTPCTLQPERLKGTTVVLQLASSIVYTSPLLHWADRWDVYMKSPALEVIKQIPATYDETVVLKDSKIGDMAAFARRKGDKWFVGIINGNDKRKYKLDTSFLGPGSYQMTCVKDVKSKPAEMKIEKLKVTSGKSINIEMETGGGFVAVITKGK